MPGRSGAEMIKSLRQLNSETVACRAVSGAIPCHSVLCSRNGNSTPPLAMFGDHRSDNTGARILA